MSSTKTTKIPTMDELRAVWEKKQPKWSSGRLKNARRWCLQERKRLQKATKEREAKAS
jgi:hypothetical protein